MTEKGRAYLGEEHSKLWGESDAIPQNSINCHGNLSRRQYGTTNTELTM